MASRAGTVVSSNREDTVEGKKIMALADNRVVVAMREEMLPKVASEILPKEVHSRLRI
jgi:hypothetical protein